MLKHPPPEGGGPTATSQPTGRRADRSGKPGGGSGVPRASALSSAARAVPAADRYGRSLVPPEATPPAPSAYVQRPGARPPGPSAPGGTRAARPGPSAADSKGMRP